MSFYSDSSEAPGTRLHLLGSPCNTPASTEKVDFGAGSISTGTLIEVSPEYTSCEVTEEVSPTISVVAKTLQEIQEIVVPAIKAIRHTSDD